jgi:hypothetical protein
MIPFKTSQSGGWRNKQKNKKMPNKAILPQPDVM